MRPRLIRIGDWMSAGINVIFFNGENDESTSGRSYREGTILGDAKWRKRQRCIDWLFSPIESEHCRKSFEADLKRWEEKVREPRRETFQSEPV